MKKRYGFLSLAAGAALLLANGCSKQEAAPASAENAHRAAAPAPAASQPVKEAVKTEIAAVVSTASNVANAAVTGAKQAVAQSLQTATNQVRDTATTLATTATNAANAAVSSARQALAQKLALSQSVPALSNPVQAVASAATNQTQALIDRAKGLVNQQQYQDALNLLQQLSRIQLTPEQQKLVADLKTQVQAVLAKQVGTNALSTLGSILGGKK